MDLMSGIVVLLCFGFGYLFGSVPFGLLITKFGGAGDVRAIGSGNIGATNVLRTGRKGLAAATLLCDALKGTIPVLLVAYVQPGAPAAMAFAGVGAFIGHCYPVWLRFVGGKGIATFVGVILAFGWPLLLAFAVIWLLTAFVTRYSSLAALLATVGVSVLATFLSSAPIAIAVVAMTALTFWRHMANIIRLRAGTEGKIGQKG